MDNQRSFPYVEDATLNSVIDRLQEREPQYLREIVGKIEMENPLIVPLAWPHAKRELVPPSLSCVVYELLSISSNRPLPRVNVDTEGDLKMQCRERLEANANNPLNAFSDIEGMIFAENKNIINYLNSAVFKTGKNGIFSEGVMVYWLIREQARKDRIASN